MGLSTVLFSPCFYTVLQNCVLLHAQAAARSVREEYEFHTTDSGQDDLVHHLWGNLLDEKLSVAESMATVWSNWKVDATNPNSCFVSQLAVVH